MIERIRPGRKITGMSAVLLPLGDDGGIEWDDLIGLLNRVVDAGLVPAVNMDTGYGSLLGPDTRRRVLECTRRAIGGASFVAGAYVDDTPGDALDLDAYARAIDEIAGFGGLPILFPSFGLQQVAEEEIVDAFTSVGQHADQFLGFELSQKFHPAGRIFELATYTDLLGIEALVGIKHSSLERQPELDRLAVRDAVRPDFWALSGNDLAIDMVMYGADYLLGLSTFAPDAFAARDRAWADGDSVRFAQLNDVLQYLGAFAFRPPVPGYRHDAARFLHRRGWISTPRTHPDSPRRPPGDDEILDQILTDLTALLGTAGS